MEPSKKERSSPTAFCFAQVEVWTRLIWRGTLSDLSSVAVLAGNHQVRSRRDLAWLTSTSRFATTIYLAKQTGPDRECSTLTANSPSSSNDDYGSHARQRQRSKYNARKPYAKTSSEMRNKTSDDGRTVVRTANSRASASTHVSSRCRRGAHFPGLICITWVILIRHNVLRKHYTAFAA